MSGLVAALGAVMQLAAAGKTVVDGVSTVQQMLSGMRKEMGPPVAVTHHLGESIELRIEKIREGIEKGKRDPRIRELTVKITSQKCGGKWCVAEKDWRREVEAVFDFVRSNVRYTRDPSGVDTYQSPQRTLAWKAGDCDCMSILLASMLASIGYPVKLRVMETRGAGTWSHILPLAGLPPTMPAGWLPLDASVNERAGWYPPKSLIVKVKDFDA